MAHQTVQTGREPIHQKHSRLKEISIKYRGFAAIWKGNLGRWATPFTGKSPSGMFIYTGCEMTLDQNRLT